MINEAQIMKDYDVSRIEEHKKHQQQYNEVVDPLLNNASDEFKELLSQYAEDAYNTNWRLTDEPIASGKQFNEGLKIFVDQADGWVDDSYYGTISLETDKGPFLNWDFTM